MEAVTKAVAEEAPKALDFTAVVTSHNARVLSTDSDGHVTKVYVTTGQDVKQGDAIAELDTADLRDKLSQATGRRDAARGEAGAAYAQAGAAQRQVMIARRLMRSGASTPEEIRKAQADYEAQSAKGAAASGQVKAAQAEIDEFNRLIGLAHVVAPIDGKVTIVRAKLGELVNKGAQLARVYDPTQLMIKFAVPHDHKDDVKAGMAIDVEVEKGQHLAATIKDVQQQADPNIDFNVAEAEFDQPPRLNEIHVGAGAHVRIADKGASR